MKVPVFVKKFILDAVETGGAAIVGLTLVAPAGIDQIKQDAIVIGVALGGAVISAARRNFPAFIVWLSSRIQTDEPEAGGPEPS